MSDHGSWRSSRNEPTDEKTPASIPTHRTCAICHELLPRHLFPKKEYMRPSPPPSDASSSALPYAACPVCHQCKRQRTAQRVKDNPTASSSHNHHIHSNNHPTQPSQAQQLQPIRQGRVADSGLVRRPNNFGYCDYVDALFAMKCFPDIVSLGAFSSAKDVSESMAVLHAASRHGNWDDSDIQNASRDNRNHSSKGSNVLCLCIGDGTTPRTAVLASFTKKWKCISIDPELTRDWIGTDPKGVKGLTGFGGTLVQYLATANDLDLSQYRHLVLLCVHSHARFVGAATVGRIRRRYGYLPTTLVSLPCCPGFRHKGDIGREPDVAYEDDCVFSACRRVEVWNFQSGRGEEDEFEYWLCQEVARENKQDEIADYSISLKSPSDLTPSIVAKLLRQCPAYSQCFGHQIESNKGDIVSSISIRDVEEGVLSHVVNVSIEYAPSFPSQALPRGMIVKFLRPESPQRRMFATEGNFYSIKNADLRSTIPFGIPTAIFTSADCIALEIIDSIGGRPSSTMKLVDGCTDEHNLRECVKLLATMHARCWVGNAADEVENAAIAYKDLDPNPGVGLAMDGLTKERLFNLRWKEYLDLYASFDSSENVIEDVKEQSDLRILCTKMSTLRLRDVHSRAVMFKPALIHGDFHVANLLFAHDGDLLNQSPPTLIDWATCGRGNPLFDLCFFLLVSTPSGGEDMAHAQQVLQSYYKILVDESTSNNSLAIQKEFPMFDGIFIGMFHTCVINEFLILVAYDRLARKFVQAADTAAKREERAQHFRNVARRCMKAVMAIKDQVDWPSPKSELEQLEEEKAMAKDDNLEVEL